MLRRRGNRCPPSKGFRSERVRMSEGTIDLFGLLEAWERRDGEDRAVVSGEVEEGAGGRPAPARSGTFAEL